MLREQVGNNTEVLEYTKDLSFTEHNAFIVELRYGHCKSAVEDDAVSGPWVVAGERIHLRHLGSKVWVRRNAVLFTKRSRVRNTKLGPF